MHSDYIVYSKMALLGLDPKIASGFISEREYRNFLMNRVNAVLPPVLRKYTLAIFSTWGEAYGGYRCACRGAEILRDLAKTPHYLYVSAPEDLKSVLMIQASYRFYESPGFLGFIVEDHLFQAVGEKWFSPCTASPLSLARPLSDAQVFILSGHRPPAGLAAPHLNDYRERYIDVARFLPFDTAIRQLVGQEIVLYVDYRKTQTFTALSEYIRSETFSTAALINDVSAGNDCYEVTLPEPFFYLWPLVMLIANADIIHLNVGTGTAGLPFVPFADPKRTVIDFYDVLLLIPDEVIRQHHNEPLELCRATEAFLCGSYDIIIHKCAGYVSAELKKRYNPRAEIVSVMEYVREPTISMPSTADNSIKLVYGGLVVNDINAVDDTNYKCFFDMVKYYCQEGLELSIYPSPYLYGFRKSTVIDQLIHRHALTHIRNCMPREENEFLREIASHDFGVFGPTHEGLRPADTGYILSFKFIPYLRAGIPILVPEDFTLLVDIVREFDIGVIFRYDDPGKIPSLLKGQDINRLKGNVRKFRENFSIKIGGPKVRSLYDMIIARKSLKGSKS